MCLTETIHLTKVSQHMASKKKRYPNETTVSRFTGTAVKTIVSSLVAQHFPPEAAQYVSGMTSELLEMLIGAPLEKRREAYINALAIRIEQNTKDITDIRKLQNNEAFHSAVIQSMVIALKTHDTEKLELLRNAVLNVLRFDQFDDMQMIFWPLIDRFTPAHIKLLQLHSNSVNWKWEPVDATQKSGQGYRAYPKKELVKSIGSDAIDDEVARHILYDLMDSNLVEKNPILTGGVFNSRPNATFEEMEIYTSTSGDNLRYGKPLTTKLGDEFLIFLTGK